MTAPPPIYSQLQIHSKDRLPIGHEIIEGVGLSDSQSQASNCYFDMGTRIRGIWELSYASMPNTVPGNQTLRITIEGTSCQTRVSDGGDTNFTIVMSVPLHSHQEYTNIGRSQCVNFGPMGVDILHILIKDDLDGLVNFGASEWLMILQRSSGMQDEPVDGSMRKRPARAIAP